MSILFTLSVNKTAKTKKMYSLFADELNKCNVKSLVTIAIQLKKTATLAALSHQTV